MGVGGDGSPEGWRQRLQRLVGPLGRTGSAGGGAGGGAVGGGGESTRRAADGDQSYPGGDPDDFGGGGGGNYGGPIGGQEEGQRWSRRFMALAAVAALVLLGVAVGREVGLRGPRLTPARPPEVIAFFENGWSTVFRDSFPPLQRHAKLIDTVLAFWYSVDGNSNIKGGKARPTVTAWVKDHHLHMGILVNNVAGSSGDLAGMLWTAAARTRAVNGIVGVVKQHGYQAVNVDFEQLPADARDSLTAFVQQLRGALPKDVNLSVSVFPSVGVPRSIWGADDYAALAKTSDYLVLMAYDHHTGGTPAGPIAPLPWVRANVQQLLKVVPANKIVLGVGVYGDDWIQGTTTATELPQDALVKLAAQQHATIHWDKASQNPYFHYTDAKGVRHVVWLQNDATVRQNIDLAKRFGLRGIAIWRLGDESPGVWEVIAKTTMATTTTTAP
jgi:spore germination protein